MHRVGLIVAFGRQIAYCILCGSFFLLVTLQFWRVFLLPDHFLGQLFFLLTLKCGIMVKRTLYLMVCSVKLLVIQNAKGSINSKSRRGQLYKKKASAVCKTMSLGPSPVQPSSASVATM